MVAVGCQGIIVIGRGHGDDVVLREARRIHGRGLDVQGAVAGGRDKDVPGVTGVRDGVGERQIEPPAPAPTVVRYLGAVRDGKVQGVDGPRGRSASGRVEELQGHDLDFPVHPGHADAVVASRADRPRHVRAVVVVVHRVAVVADEVVAVHIVDVSVLVVVDAIAGNLTRVHPHVRLEVRMVVIDAGVDDGDDRLAAAGGDVPGGRRLDIGACLATGLPGVVHPPFGGKIGVVGKLVARQPIIRLGKDNVFVGLEGRDGVGEALAGRHVDLVQTGHQRHLFANRSAGGQKTAWVDRGVEFHQNRRRVVHIGMGGHRSHKRRRLNTILESQKLQH